MLLLRLFLQVRDVCLQLLDLLEKIRNLLLEVLDLFFESLIFFNLELVGLFLFYQLHGLLLELIHENVILCLLLFQLGLIVVTRASHDRQLLLQICDRRLQLVDQLEVVRSERPQLLILHHEAGYFGFVAFDYLSLFGLEPRYIFSIGIILSLKQFILRVHHALQLLVL